ncbi:MAG: magnesium transporter CorA family protein [Anaerolineae bacterium]|nr:magnesium transporter CorA family protein [Anaerolineae bacterium]
MPYESLVHHNVTWVNITVPTADDMARLHEAYPQFHPLNLEDCLNPNERPKLDDYDDHLFVVVQFPLWDKVNRISRPSEVHLFAGAGYVVTVHNDDLKPLVSLFGECQSDPKARETYIGASAGHLLHSVLDHLVDYLSPILAKIDTKIQSIEENLFAEDIRRTIHDISFVRRDLIALRRITRPQLSVFHSLEHEDRSYIKEELDVYFGDILDHLEKACDMIEEDAEVITSLADTNDALASYRTNEVIRILTIISVAILPLTLLAGLYGMNVSLPLEHRPDAFWIVVGMMAVVTLAMLFVFRYRRWL